jgi:hypothetical protein
MHNMLPKVMSSRKFDGKVFTSKHRAAFKTMHKEKIQGMNTAAMELFHHPNSSRQISPPGKNRMSVCARHPE